MCKQIRPAMRIESCIDNGKNLTVLKMMQFDLLKRHYGVIISSPLWVFLINIIIIIYIYIYIYIYIWGVPTKLKLP